MNCPSCNSNETKVIDSRLSGEGFSIRRRRSCQSCSFRFSTIEEIEILDLVVIKRDGHRENYTRDKLKHTYKPRLNNSLRISLITYSQNHDPMILKYFSCFTFFRVH